MFIVFINFSTLNKENFSEALNFLDQIVYISNFEDLKQIASSCNNEDFRRKIKLVDNIFIKTSENEETLGDFLSISFNKNFNGVLDGNGKTIVFGLNNFNLMKNKPKEAQYFFKLIGSDGVLKNLRIVGCISNFFSGIVYENQGIIDNVKTEIVIKNDNNVSGVCCLNKGIIKNCEIKGDFTANYMRCAGICECNEGLIFNCNIFASLVCAEKLKSISRDICETGGVSSINLGFIDSCEVNSTIVSRGITGGLVAVNMGTIEKSILKNGAIYTKFGGGLVGNNYGIVNCCRVLKSHLEGDQIGEFIYKNYYYIQKDSNILSLGSIKNCKLFGNLAFSKKFKKVNTCGVFFNLCDCNDDFLKDFIKIAKIFSITQCQINDESCFQLCD
jgi:hypothetical protein